MERHQCPETGCEDKRFTGRPGLLMHYKRKHPKMAPPGPKGEQPAAPTTAKEPEAAKPPKPQGKPKAVEPPKAMASKKAQLSPKITGGNGAVRSTRNVQRIAVEAVGAVMVAEAFTRAQERGQEVFDRLMGEVNFEGAGKDGIAVIFSDIVSQARKAAAQELLR